MMMMTIFLMQEKFMKQKKSNVKSSACTKHCKKYKNEETTFHHFGFHDFRGLGVVYNYLSSNQYLKPAC